MAQLKWQCGVCGKLFTQGWKVRNAHEARCAEERRLARKEWIEKNCPQVRK